MLLRIFALKFNSALSAFDDTDFQAFIKDKEVLSVKDHFFVKDETPYLALVVAYRAGNLPETVTSSSTPQEKTRSDAWRDILEERDWPLFNTLRDWRNHLAQEEGIPPYVICTNRQLAFIAHRRPPTLEQLARVEGLGKNKLERYGQAILALAKPDGEDSANSNEEPADASQ